MKTASILAICPIGILVAVAGAFLCRLAGVNIHARDLALAAGICLVSGELGVTPLLLNRNVDVDKNPAARFQSAWMGTVVHLGLAAVLGVAAIMLLRPDVAFVYWLLAMFWLTLIALCAVMVRVLRTPPVRPACSLQ